MLFRFLLFSLIALPSLASQMNCQQFLLGSQKQTISVKVVSNNRVNNSSFPFQTQLVSQVEILSSSHEAALGPFKIGDVISLLGITSLRENPGKSPYDRYMDDIYKVIDRPYEVGEIIEGIQLELDPFYSMFEGTILAGSAETNKDKYNLVIEFPGYPARDEQPKKKKSRSKKVKDRREWDRLDESFREDIISNKSGLKGLRFEEIEVSGMQEFKKLIKKQPEQTKKFLNKVYAFIKDNVSTEIEDTGFDTYVTVGELQITVEIVMLKNGEIIGGEVNVFQLGASVVDTEEEVEELHFDTEEEATAAGADVGADVSWRNISYHLFDGEDIEPFDYDHPMEWSGH